MSQRPLHLCRKRRGRRQRCELQPDVVVAPKLEISHQSKGRRVLAPGLFDAGRGRSLPYLSTRNPALALFNRCRTFLARGKQGNQGAGGARANANREDRMRCVSDRCSSLSFSLQLSFKPVIVCFRQTMYDDNSLVHQSDTCRLTARGSSHLAIIEKTRGSRTPMVWAIALIAPVDSDIRHTPRRHGCQHQVIPRVVFQLSLPIATLSTYVDCNPPSLSPSRVRGHARSAQYVNKWLVVVRPEGAPTPSSSWP